VGEIGATKHTGFKPAWHLIDPGFGENAINDDILEIVLADPSTPLLNWAQQDKGLDYLECAARNLASMYGTQCPGLTAQLELARVLAHGAAKYDHDGVNYRKGHVWSGMWRAAIGHIASHTRGDLYDGESGLLHLSHALGQIMFLYVHQRDGLGHDDREEIWPRT
jgi:hypothetical protein